MMDKSKLGKRYDCFKCNTKFYDLNRPVAVCPECAADQADNPVPDPRLAFLEKFKGRGGKRSEDTVDEESEEDEDGEIEEDEVEDEEEEIEGGEEDE